MVENKGNDLTKDVVMNPPWMKQGEIQVGTERNKNESDSNTQFQVCLFIAKGASFMGSHMLKYLFSLISSYVLL